MKMTRLKKTLLIFNELKSYVPKEISTSDLMEAADEFLMSFEGLKPDRVSYDPGPKFNYYSQDVLSAFNNRPWELMSHEFNNMNLNCGSDIFTKRNIRQYEEICWGI